MKRTVFKAFIIIVAIASMGASQGDIERHPNCTYCGMDRQIFSHSRMYIEYDDGTSVGFCSLHCAALDLALMIDKTPKSIMVADYESKKLIDAENAIWVIGGSKPGVMSKRAKWAFENKNDAEAFIKENSGVISTFDEAIKSAYEDMYEDSKMIREKRKMNKKKTAMGSPHQGH
jgi:copper chaperone NosL